jgi:ribosomal protein S19
LAIPKVKPGEKPPPIKTQARAATILPSFVGLRFQVHNGKNYIEFEVTEDMVGHKLGEFSMYGTPISDSLALTLDAEHASHSDTAKVETKRITQSACIKSNRVWVMIGI